MPTLIWREKQQLTQYLLNWTGILVNSCFVRWADHAENKLFTCFYIGSGGIDKPTT